MAERNGISFEPPVLSDTAALNGLVKDMLKKSKNKMKTLGILFGLFMAFTGGASQDYFYGLFIGFTLLGAAYYNNQAWKKACKEEAQEM